MANRRTHSKIRFSRIFKRPISAWTNALRSSLKAGTRAPDAEDMISVDEQTELLDGTTWARGLSWQQIRALAAYMSEESADPGTVLVREGERDVFLCVLAEGQVEVAKRDTFGDEQLVARLTRGQSFGEMSLLDGEPRSATVRALTPVRFLRLSPERLEHLIDEKPRLGVEVYRRLGRMASKNLRRTSGQLVDAQAVDGTRVTRSHHPPLPRR